jgi:hypothetical protein
MLNRGQVRRINALERECSVPKSYFTTYFESWIVERNDQNELIRIPFITTPVGIIAHSKCCEK